MDLYYTLAILVTLTALFGYINHKFLGLPVTIGVMLIALILSLVIILLGMLGFGLEAYANRVLSRIEFDRTLLHGMLSFLLFAGSLHININDLAEGKWIIGSLSTVGTLLSMFFVGTIVWLILTVLKIPLSYIYCLLFGALISPTDPIAVLGILKTAGAPKSLEIKIAGESLFNDGIGVVAFLILLEIALGTHPVSAGHVGMLFCQEVMGGAVLGSAIGFIAYRMIKSVDNYQVELMITLALVTGGYALARAIHVSGPIAIVVAGLLVGNQGRLLAMSEKTRDHLDLFWELIDEILNAVLFLLIGLEVLVLTFPRYSVLAGLLVIPTVLMVRFVVIGCQVTLLRPIQRFNPGAIVIMTWAGLRGGISVALALSLPTGYTREIILTITYAVVIFSVLVQGLTIGKVVRKQTMKNK
ncbi:MAG: sodium:proton antiporter [Desulfobacterales bacterium]|jgi:CPA1 family monovalent cation:H+ antiporter|nr:sodium:proton antiporter [Desulfobacter sp.]MDP6394775.1 sodium:proton antiporter [Desulfobacterales bacterium]MDP6681529.1 sodium:proton antiporter [Desulfobacterales bacterium]MDP6806852.1 sodium:proton antiporter [Desulfobacterales bacterium]|tara:strand:- start:21577 stop:22818 length:1242 start_codon:yes stop_codon:yes gene_type:complete